jgi:hypothetical protein
MGRFSLATSSTVGEVGKDASKKGTTSVDVVVQAFAPTSSNPHTIAARDPTLPGRMDAAKIQQQPHPSAAQRCQTGEVSGEAHQESAAHQNRQSQPTASRSGQLRHESQHEEGGRQLTGRRGSGSEEAPVA